MYIHDDFAYKELDKGIILPNTSNLFESQCVELWRKTSAYQKYIISNIYRLTSYIGDDLSTFTDEYTNLLNILRTFYEHVMSCCFVPKITLPTKICDTASTLIDNIYTNVLDKSHTS